MCVCAGQVPRCVDCAQRHREKARQFAEEDYGLAEYDLSRGSTLLIRGMELGFCKDFEANGLNARRLLLQKEVFEKVAEQKTAECMLVELKHAFVKCLRQLRVSDTDRLYMDRKHGSFVSENSNVWIWAQIVRS